MLNVEEDKFYRNGCGELVGPMERVGLEGAGLFQAATNNQVYDRRGRIQEIAEPEYDLVECVDGESLYDEVLTCFGPIPGVPGETDLEPITKADILQEAIGTVAQRGEAYDGVEDNFVRIARYWNAHLINRFGAEVVEKCELNPLDVAQMMILMKQARIDFKQDHHDSWVDTCGYGGCGGELAAAERGDQ
jgi:hypothetical protein